VLFSSDAGLFGLAVEAVIPAPRSPFDPTADVVNRREWTETAIVDIQSAIGSRPAAMWKIRVSESRVTSLDAAILFLRTTDAPEVVERYVRNHPDLQVHGQPLLRRELLGWWKGLNGRVNAAIAFGEIGGSLALDSLCRALSNRNNLVRYYALKALLKLENKDKNKSNFDVAVGPISRCLKDADEHIRATAAKLLRNIGNERSVSALCATLDTLYSSASVDYGAVASALASSGAPEAAEHLVRHFLRNPSPSSSDEIAISRQIRLFSAVSELLSHKPSSFSNKALKMLIETRVRFSYPGYVAHTDIPTTHYRDSIDSIQKTAREELGRRL
jgi:hypothetical protein